MATIANEKKVPPAQGEGTVVLPDVTAALVSLPPTVDPEKIATPAAAPPPPPRVAVLARPDGPYEAGQAVTVDPHAPWEKGGSPAFLDDGERVAVWRAAGKPIHVDEKRYAAWERDGFFSKAEKTIDKKVEGGQ